MTIAIVGDTNVSLRRVLNSLAGFAYIGNITPSEVSAVVNCSYNEQKMARLRTRYPFLEQNSVRVFNEKLIMNKLDHLSSYEEQGVQTPQWTIDDDTSDYSESEWVLKPINSERGRGISILTPGTRVPTRHYVQKKVNKTREFRAHVALFLPEEEQCFSIQEKKPKPEVHTSTSIDNLPLCWNIDNGFYYRRSTTPENRAEKYRRHPIFKRIGKLGVKAVKSLGYDFGAVDIVMDSERNLFVLETNSHPALKNDSSKEVYKQAFGRLPGLLSTSSQRRSTRTVTISRGRS